MPTVAEPLAQSVALLAELLAWRGTDATLPELSTRDPIADTWNHLAVSMNDLSPDGLAAFVGHCADLMRAGLDGAGRHRLMHVMFQWSGQMWGNVAAMLYYRATLDLNALAGDRFGDWDARGYCTCGACDGRTGNPWFGG